MKTKTNTVNTLNLPKHILKINTGSEIGFRLTHATNMILGLIIKELSKVNVLLD